MSALAEKFINNVSRKAELNHKLEDAYKNLCGYCYPTSLSKPMPGYEQEYGEIRTEIQNLSAQIKMMEAYI